ncbi:SDR family NAD(P)-dependent oxidoreductase [Billgrantia bachuensis]|uniref:SDR family oxidoreductase n=1 Tax=Billgrantia bachuensis TaxID=2717286 RepID=A0ABX0PW64_9GAMM|nr:SDR family oxidoreductase [Halomonas bachuensis]NIC06781.1 SDR family oxidoreductase [Halomonas bachuensis]
MRIAAILGGAGGIGSSIAELLLAGGDFVYLLDREPAQDRAATLVARWPESCAFIACDLHSPDDIATAFAHIEAHGAGLDVCINAAGVIQRERFVEVSPTALDEILATNVSGTYLALQAAARLMIATGGGHLVIVSSAHGLRTTAERSAYAMCKGAMLALGRALAVELAPHGILVNAVAPGPVSTGMQDAESQSRRRWQAATPLGRVAEADEVARAVVFLASAENTFITGDTLMVDGGANVAM